MGCCKSRQTTKSAVKKVGSKQYQNEDTYTPKSNAKSWARLRGDAALNPDAAPFMPSQAPGNVEGLRARPWAKDLQPSLQGEPNRSNAKQIRTRRPDCSIAGRGCPRQPTHAQPQSQPQSGCKLNSSTVPDFVLCTNDYKKLLQESSGGSNACARGGAKTNAAPWRRDKPPIAPTTEVAAPAPTAALGKMLVDVLVTPTIEKNSTDSFDTEGTLHTKPRQFLDDAFLERFLDLRDYSEQAYWSDGGDGKFPAPRGRSALTPSAHRSRRTSIDRRIKAVRSYVMQDFSEKLDQAVSLFLGQLQFFQQLEVLDQEPPPVDDAKHRALRRAGKQTKSLPPNRRFFVGLKEVHRRLRQNLVKVVIVAPDLEGSIDDRMRDLLAYAYQNEVPVIFALSRKRIGKALGKNLDFSIVGIVNVEGARKLCDESINLAREHQLAWLDRAEREKQKSYQPGKRFNQY